MDFEKELKNLVNEYALELPARTWVYESDRWEHLVFCLLRQYADQDPEKARSAVTILRDTGLLELEGLGAMIDTSPDTFKAFSQVLLGAGFSDLEIDRAANLISRVAGVIQGNYDGKVHRIFRHYAEIIREELVESIADPSITESDLREGITYWLQSAFSLPIPADRQAVMDYCEENGTTPEQLWQTADDLGINLGILDFLLERQASPEPGLRTSGPTEQLNVWKLT